MFEIEVDGVDIELEDLVDPNITVEELSEHKSE